MPDIVPTKSSKFPATLISISVLFKTYWIEFFKKIDFNIHLQFGISQLLVGIHHNMEENLHPATKYSFWLYFATVHKCASR